MISSNYNITMSGNFPNWMLILGMLISIMFSIWSYIHTLPPVRTYLRIVLITVRGLALCGGLVLLHHTVIESHRSVMSPASISFLLDRSASMAMIQGGVDRKEQVENIFDSATFGELGELYDVKVWSFDDSLSAIYTTSRDNVTTAPEGVGTNISRAWMELNEKTINDPQAMTIIISDGAHNSGPDPIRYLRSASSPVWTVGIGSDKTYRDAMLLQVISNPVVYQGSKTPIEVGYRVVGISGELLEISIRDSENRLLKTTKVNLAHRANDKSSGSEENHTIEGKIDFNLDITEIGKQRFSVDIKQLDGEIVTENNKRSFYINALSHKMIVLLIAGSPNNSLGNLVRLLSADEHIELIQLTSRGNSFYEGTWPDDKLLAMADVVLFHDFPTKLTNSKKLTTFIDGVNTAELPVAYIDGSGVSYSKMKKLTDLFSFTLTKSRAKLREGRLNPVLHHAIIADPEDIGYEQKWDGMPPLRFSTFKIKIGKDNTVLAEFITENGESTFPAIVISEKRNTKSAIILAHDLWRWSFTESSSEQVLQPLYSRLIRWLAVRKAGKQVEIKLTKDLYSSGELINFTVSVLNENYLQVDDAIVTSEISLADTVGGVTVLDPFGKGKYFGSFYSWGEGEYSIKVSASRADQLIGTDVGRVSVEAFNIELLDSRMNKELLTSIGESTGGGYISAADVDSFMRSIDIPPTEKLVVQQWIFWGSGWLLGAIIILLSIEWLIRIANGLL